MNNVTRFLTATAFALAGTAAHANAAVAQSSLWQRYVLSTDARGGEGRSRLSGTGRVQPYAAGAATGKPDGLKQNNVL